MPERPYSRIYHSVEDDPKFSTVFDDDRLFATWVRLLIEADKAHPSTAHVPEGTSRSAVRALSDLGIVDLGTGSRYRIHGLDAERAARSDAARVGGLASGRSRSVEQSLNGRSTTLRTKTNLDETSKDETSKDEWTRAEHGPDPWDDPEGEAVAWLAKHGCALLPSSGYYRHLVVMVEHHGVNAVVGMFDRLATAGTHEGDVKGYIFGARDALDAKTRPKLGDLAKEERTEEIDRSNRRSLERTQAYLAELRGETA